MKDSRSSKRADSATYATLNIIPPLCMQLTLKPMTASDTVSATTSITGVTHNGNESEQSTTSLGANTYGQSEATSSIKLLIG